MPDIDAIQKALKEQKLDGWLFYDILHRDAIAYRVLGLDHGMAKRRWFYMIPAKGAPRKLEECRPTSRPTGKPWQDPGLPLLPGALGAAVLPEQTQPDGGLRREDRGWRIGNRG